MTTATPPSRGLKIAAVAYMLLRVAWTFTIYGYSWWRLTHLSHPMNVAAFMLGFFAPIAVAAVCRTTLTTILAGAALVGGLWFASPRFEGSVLDGFALLVVVVGTASFLSGFIRGCRRDTNTPTPAAAATSDDEPLLVGLSGYAEAGKDTAAAALIADGWKRVSFADKLREFAYTLNPYVEIAFCIAPDCPCAKAADGRRFARLADLVDAVGWDRAKNENPDVRELLQRLGTDCGRKILGENVWVDTVMRDLPDGDLVFTDVRFLNEANAIKAAGGAVVRITRPGVEPVNGHVSEHALDGYAFNAYVTNDSTVRALAARMRLCVRKLADLR